MDGHVLDHRGNTIVEGAGHWVQQEAPDEVNAALLQFLGSLDRKGADMRAASLKSGTIYVKEDVPEPVARRSARCSCR